MQTIIALSVFALLAILLPVVGRTNKNHAYHTPVYAQLPYASITERVGQSPEGRRVQEIGETRVQNLFGFAAAVLAAPFMHWGFALLIGMFVIFGTYKIGTFWDTMGHGAEILVAEREARPAYREEEIRRMLLSHKHKGRSFKEIDKQMRRWEWVSRLMILLAAY